jgi:ATP-dependent Zn protease
MTTTQETECIAFHEASHAVVHYYFKLPVFSVEIEQTTGRCVPPPDWPVTLSKERAWKLAHREALMQLIVGACSGKAAMDRWYNYKSESDHNWKQSDDYKTAFKHALQINNGDHEGAERLMAWLERRAELLVEQHWPQIHKLAFALLEREKITGPELNKIIHDSKPQ